MRGKDAEPKGTDQKFRITPAYAGKRGRCLQILQEQEDHPRLCGEKDSPLLNSTLILGSPPPMRGKDREPADTGCTDGITPAYAGKSSYTTAAESEENRITPAYAGKRQTVISSDVAKRDHPRLCGEKFLCRSGRMSSTGSPPPMRGKVRWRTRLLPRSGINVINLTSSQAS